MLAVAEYPGRRAQANRSALPLDRGQNRIADEGAAAPRAIGQHRSQPVATVTHIYAYGSMGLRMKTTIELADDLAMDARRYAARHRVTLRSIIEDGIRMKLRTERTRSAFRLRDAAVEGSGLQPEFRDAGWPAVRKAIYEGRGA